MSGDRPDARELVDAVADWLANELAPSLEAGPRFQAMVAAQALAIAARELRRRLADAIAAGEHDDDLPAIASVLREHVRRKLAIARPGYDAADLSR
jgi:Domain of unknown function (DUF6285)